MAPAQLLPEPTLSKLSPADQPSPTNEQQAVGADRDEKPVDLAPKTSLFSSVSTKALGSVSAKAFGTVSTTARGLFGRLRKGRGVSMADYLNAAVPEQDTAS